MVKSVDRVKLLAVREGVYTTYVYQKLDTHGYIMCTRLPNWQVPEIGIGNIGFLEHQTVVAGETYFNVATGATETYYYSNVYFINFIQQTDILENNEIIL